VDNISRDARRNISLAHRARAERFLGCAPRSRGDIWTQDAHALRAKTRVPPRLASRVLNIAACGTHRLVLS